MSSLKKTNSVSELNLGGEPPVLVNKSDALPDSPPETGSPSLGGTKVEAGQKAGEQKVVANTPEDDVWVAEDAWKSAGQAVEDFKGLGKGVVSLASTAGKEAAAAMQEISDKMKVPVDFTQLSSKLTSWWSSLDASVGGGNSSFEQVPPAADNNTSSSAREDAANSVPLTSVNLQALFGIPAQEELIEAFSCKLIQTYKCTHNDFTPEIPMAFRGTLYITDSYICFYVTEGNRNIPIKIEQMSVEGVVKQQVRRGAKEELIKLKLGNDNWLAVKEFATIDDKERTVALLEHMCEAARN
jgi:hypothetical protein